MRACRALAAAALLCACATTPVPDVAGARQTWQGATYEEVQRAWGNPARSTTLPDGREERIWISEINRSRGVIYPSVGVFGGSGNVGVGVGVGTSAPFGSDLQRCERTVIFAGGRVEDQAWTGPDEYCATFRR